MVGTWNWNKIQIHSHKLFHVNTLGIEKSTVLTVFHSFTASCNLCILGKEKGQHGNHFQRSSLHFCTWQVIHTLKLILSANISISSRMFLCLVITPIQDTLLQHCKQVAYQMAFGAFVHLVTIPNRL